ncbi:MAG: hypothetical protein LAQ69_31990 [Acidobacteriia bacterium]|nr:hypothetical protein [Terriglobia bacterium]
MRLLKKVLYTSCSGDLDKECDNFLQRKQLPEFKRNCPSCGSKTKEVLGVNHIGIASLLVLFFIAAGAVYWQIHRVRSTAVDLVQQATSQAVFAIRESKSGPKGTDPDAKPALSSSQPTPCGLRPVNQPDVNRLLTYLKQGMNYATQHRYDLALNEFEQVRQIDPNFLAMHEDIAAAQLKLKKFPDAENHLEEELKLIGCLDQMNDTDLPKFAYMLEVGQEGGSNSNLARALAMRKRIKQARGAAHYNLACIRSHQGITEQALAELRQAVENGFSDVSALRRDPDLANVRSARGFQEVLDAAATNRETP